MVGRRKKTGQAATARFDGYFKRTLVDALTHTELVLYFCVETSSRASVLFAMERRKKRDPPHSGIFVSYELVPGNQAGNKAPLTWPTEAALLAFLATQGAARELTAHERQGLVLPRYDVHSIIRQPAALRSRWLPPLPTIPVRGDFRAFRVDRGKFSDGRNYRRFWLVDESKGGVELLAVVGQDGPKKNRVYCYKAQPEFGGWTFDNGTSVEIWLGALVGLPEIFALPAPSPEVAPGAAGEEHDWSQERAADDEPPAKRQALDADVGAPGASPTVERVAQLQAVAQAEEEHGAPEPPQEAHDELHEQGLSALTPQQLVHWATGTHSDDVVERMMAWAKKLQEMAALQVPGCTLPAPEGSAPSSPRARPAGPSSQDSPGALSGSEFRSAQRLFEQGVLILEALRRLEVHEPCLTLHEASRISVPVSWLQRHPGQQARHLACQLSERWRAVAMAAVAAYNHGMAVPAAQPLIGPVPQGALGAPASPVSLAAAGSAPPRAAAPKGESVRAGRGSRAPQRAGGSVDGERGPNEPASGGSPTVRVVDVDAIPPAANGTPSPFETSVRVAGQRPMAHVAGGTACGVGPRAARDGPPPAGPGPLQYEQRRSLSDPTESLLGPATLARLHVASRSVPSSPAHEFQRSPRAEPKPVPRQDMVPQLPSTPTSQSLSFRAWEPYGGAPPTLPLDRYRADARGDGPAAHGHEEAHGDAQHGEAAKCAGTPTSGRARARAGHPRRALP